MILFRFYILISLDFNGIKEPDSEEEHPRSALGKTALNDLLITKSKVSRARIHFIVCCCIVLCNNSLYQNCSLSL